MIISRYIICYSPGVSTKYEMSSMFNLQYVFLFKVDNIVSVIHRELFRMNGLYKIALNCVDNNIFIYMGDKFFGDNYF